MGKVGVTCGPALALRLYCHIFLVILKIIERERAIAEG